MRPGESTAAHQARLQGATDMSEQESGLPGTSACAFSRVACIRDESIVAVRTLWRVAGLASMVSHGLHWCAECAGELDRENQSDRGLIIG